MYDYSCTGQSIFRLILLPEHRDPGLQRPGEGSCAKKINKASSSLFLSPVWRWSNSRDRESDQGHLGLFLDFIVLS